MVSLTLTIILSDYEVILTMKYHSKWDYLSDSLGIDPPGDSHWQLHSSFVNKSVPLQIPLVINQYPLYLILASKQCLNIIVDLFRKLKYQYRLNIFYRKTPQMGYWKMCPPPSMVWWNIYTLYQLQCSKHWMVSQLMFAKFFYQLLNFTS